MESDCDVAMLDLRHLSAADARLAAGDDPQVRINRGGCHRAEERWQGQTFAHADIGLYLVDEPGMWAETASRRWAYVAGAITVIPPWWTYTYRFRPGMGHAYLHLDVPAWPAALLRRHLTHPLVLRDRAVVQVFRAWCVRLRAGASAGEQRLGAQHLALSALSALTTAVPQLAAEVLHRDGAWRHLRPALDLVEAHLAEPLAVGDLAAALGCSREHCARLFRKHLGQTPVHYIQERRVARAMELLRGGATVTHAAGAVGAGTRQYLGRLVRRHLGRPPSQLVQAS